MNYERKKKACYQCTKRYLGCHSECKEYLDEVESNRIRNEAKHKDAELRNTLYRSTAHRVNAIAKKRLY